MFLLYIEILRSTNSIQIVALSIFRNGEMISLQYMLVIEIEEQFVMDMHGRKRTQT